MFVYKKCVFNVLYKVIKRLFSSVVKKKNNFKISVTRHSYLVMKVSVNEFRIETNLANIYFKSKK